MSGVNEAGIRWKDNVLIRGGLADVMNVFFLRKSRSKACRKKSADAIVVQYSITLHEGQNLTWCERSENESRKKTTSFSSYSICLKSLCESRGIVGVKPALVLAK